MRVLAQRQGFADARRVPDRLADGRFGKSWCTRAGDGRDQQALSRAARQLLAGEMLALGHPVPLAGGVPDWNRDPVTATALPLRFGLLMDFRHQGNDVDIKYLWEVNRHLWWVTLAQGYAITGDRAYLERIGALLESWLEACPYPLGPNWTSPVEHGIRLINWSLVWHLIGGHDSPVFAGAAGASLRDRLLDGVYRHVRFARDNYSFYSSADNHLIGEAAGVYVAAKTWDLWDDVRQMGAEAKVLLEREAGRQFADDGVNREQAFCYHKFALQFLIAAGLCGRAQGDEFSGEYWGRVESGLAFLAAVTDCAGRVPPVGDGDDSDVFRLGHEEGYSSYQGLLALGARLFPGSNAAVKCNLLGIYQDPTVDWLLGPGCAGGAVSAQTPAVIPVLFEQGGYALLGNRLHQPDELRVLFDIGPLGYNRVAGHGHADALSVVVSRGGRDLLVDPGTYCYNSAPGMRRYFRGTAAHNTVVVDGRDQADYGSSFLWLSDVTSTLREYREDGSRVIAEAQHDGYRRLPDPVTHCRRVTLHRDALTLEVEDWIECRGQHDVQVCWHFAANAQLESREDGAWRILAGGQHCLVEMSGPGLLLAAAPTAANPPQGWVSPRFNVLEEAPVLVAGGRLGPKERVRTLFRFDR